MESIKISPTSRSTAKCDDIQLRCTQTTRLVFRPLLIDNPHDKTASIKGTFYFQRKGKNDTWEDYHTTDLSTIRAHDGIKLELKSEELLVLVKDLIGLYRLYKSEGIPHFATTFVKPDEHINALLQLKEPELNSYLQSNKETGLSILSRFLVWLSKASEPSVLLSKLEGIEPTNLQSLNSLIGLSTLKAAHKDWENGKLNSNEEFWQKYFLKNTFLLTQLFEFPIVILSGKAYIGGKAINNQNGNIIDFLAKNKLSQNAVLIEIKPPTTKLLGSLYRGDIYTVSSELSGAVTQIANYRYSICRDFATLSVQSKDEFYAYYPRCSIIIGNAISELNDSKKMKSFELYRCSLKDIQIITFDELFEKTQSLINLIGSGT